MSIKDERDNVIANIHRLPNGGWTNYGELCISVGYPSWLGRVLSSMLARAEWPGYEYKVRNKDGIYRDYCGDNYQEEFDRRLRESGCPVEDHKADPAHKCIWVGETWEYAST